MFPEVGSSSEGSASLRGCVTGLKEGPGDGLHGEHALPAGRRFLHLLLPAGNVGLAGGAAGWGWGEYCCGFIDVIIHTE